MPDIQTIVADRETSNSDVYAYYELIDGVSVGDDSGPNAIDSTAEVSLGSGITGLFDETHAEGDGSATRIDLPTSFTSGLDTLTGLTIMGWVYVDSSASGNDRFFYAENSSSEQCLSLHLNGSSLNFSFRLSPGGTAYGENIGTFTADTWQFFSFAIDVDNDEYRYRLGAFTAETVQDAFTFSESSISFGTSGSTPGIFHQTDLEHWLGGGAHLIIIEDDLTEAEITVFAAAGDADYQETCADTGALTSLLSRLYQDGAPNSLFITGLDTPLVNLYAQAADTGSLTASASVAQYLVTLTDLLTYSDLFSSTQNIGIVAEDTASLVTAIRLIFPKAAADTINSTDTLSHTVTRLVTLLNELAATDTVATTADLYAAATAAAALSDAILLSYTAQIGDTASATDDMNDILARYVIVASTMLATTSATNSVGVLMTAPNTAALTDTISTSAQFHAVLANTIDAIVAININGDVYYGLVVNSETGAISTYNNYNYDGLGFSEQTGVLTGIKADGWYSLTGDTDAGTAIQWRLKTGMMDFASLDPKYMPEMEIGYTADDRIVLKVGVIHEGEREEYWYEMIARTATAPTRAPIDLRQGVNSELWQFEITSTTAGSEFSLHDIKWYPIYFYGPPDIGGGQ